MLYSNGRTNMNEINFIINSDDSHVVSKAINVELFNKDEYHYNFFNKKRRFYRLPNFFSNEAIDLCYISLMIYYADKKFLRKDSFDAWTRNIKIYIPVLEIDKWNTHKELLINLLSYLSGDIWNIQFRKRDYTELELKFKKNIPLRYKTDKFEFEAISMLSGGLDSFIGAIDLLNRNIDTAFLGHYGGGKGVKPYQDTINNLLIEKYKVNLNNFFNFYAAPLNCHEDSSRTRSFMFFTHAIILASSFKRKTKIYIPENGLISLNIPLTNTRLGTSSTRTTHPYYLDLFQELINKLDLNSELTNLYQFKTKGEMISECKNNKFLEDNYNKTMSCSHPDLPRYKGKSKSMHCGTCLPCIIRRSSIYSAYGTDKTQYFDPSFEEKKAKADLKSYKIGIKKFNEHMNSPFTIQIAGEIKSNMEKYSILYKRGMKELKNFLNTINE